MKRGTLNKITDVTGVKVGHYTVDTPEHHTGVTVILPSSDFVFQNKLTAASFVLNGFGKTQGLVQIDELGTLETPIALTNTLNIGKVHDALVEYMVQQAEQRDLEIRSINPVVGECNDSSLNRITERILGIREVRQAIESACEDFEEGDVGAGKGTTCFGLKGGIGSASRLFTVGSETYTLGVLVQSNFGSLQNLRIEGSPVGREIAPLLNEAGADKGSIMIIAATDLPVTDRQLRRIIKRAGVGLARLGSYWGHGSGDVVIGFSTAQTFQDSETAGTISVRMLNEEYINEPFRAMSEATEEAVVHSMLYAGPVNGRRSLKEFFQKNGNFSELVL